MFLPLAISALLVLVPALGSVQPEPGSGPLARLLAAVASYAQAAATTTITTAREAIDATTAALSRYRVSVRITTTEQTHGRSRTRTVASVNAGRSGVSLAIGRSATFQPGPVDVEAAARRTIERATAAAAARTVQPAAAALAAMHRAAERAAIASYGAAGRAVVACYVELAVLRARYQLATQTPRVLLLRVAV